jgi:sec-independent protein translocase protein TatC
MMIRFLSNINQSIGATETYGITQYFKMMFGIILPVSLMFEMPVLILFLTKIGLVSPQFLTKIRKAAYFALVTMAIIITPPDFISDFIFSIPLLILYEVSILCSKWIYKKRV